MITVAGRWFLIPLGLFISVDLAHSFDYPFEIRSNPIPCDSWSSDQAICLHYDLWFDDWETTVPLGDWQVDPEYAQGLSGVDSASVELTWIEPDSLLLVSWSDIPQGSGGYTETWYSLYFIHAERMEKLLHGRGGGSRYHDSFMEFSFDKSSRSVQILCKNLNRMTSDKREPLMRPNEWGFGLDLLEIETRSYHLDGDALIYQHGQGMVDLGQIEYPIDEFIQHFEIDRSVLLKLNPSLTGKSVVSGQMIVSAELPPYGQR